MNDTVRQKFTGKERDDETGLDDFLARRYLASLGRFTSADPVFISFGKTQSPQTWNLYAYVGNNPLSYADPTGMERVKLGQHTDEEIEKRLKEVNKEIDRIGKIKNKTDEQKKEQEKLKAERTTLGIEKEGNKVVGALLKSLESRGELNGLKLSDFTVTTDSANDFKDEPRIVGDPGAGAAMFVLNGYSTEIFINTKSNDYAIYKSGDADAVLYGGTVLRHEQVHRDNYPDGDTSEKAAYTEQLKILQKYGPAAFQNKEFYKTVIDHVTKGTQKTN
jgi:RHS repeat-associated protein